MVQTVSICAKTVTCEKAHQLRGSERSWMLLLRMDGESEDAL